MVWANAPEANANAETKAAATIRERISALLRKAGGKPEHKLNPPFVMLFRLARKGSPEAISEWPLLPVPVGFGLEATASRVGVSASVVVLKAGEDLHLRWTATGTTVLGRG